MTDSRRKGMEGMRQACKALSRQGLKYILNPQWRGGHGQPDIIPDEYAMPRDWARILHEHFHFEVKRRERGNVEVWLKQAESDSAQRMAVVIHRKSNEDWKATFRLCDAVDLILSAVGIELMVDDGESHQGVDDG